MTARLALLLVCSLVGASPGLAADPPSAADLEAELVCPTCKTTLDQSNAPVALRMKQFIRERIAAGDSEEQIKDALVAQFGDGVLADPAKSGLGLLAWLLPLTMLVVGAVGVGVLVRSWSGNRGRAAEHEQPLDADLEHRLDEELARFDD
jgi:cytochrome c-type biogenesis protein CcmH